MRFIVDSSSTHRVLDESYLCRHASVKKIPPFSVKVASELALQCRFHPPDCSWKCQEFEFVSNIILLALGAYDGILSLDRLAQHSPM